MLSCLNSLLVKFGSIASLSSVSLKLSAWPLLDDKPYVKYNVASFQKSESKKSEIQGFVSYYHYA